MAPVMVLLRSIVAHPIAHEGLLARISRWARDRRTLSDLDDRLLRDIGLTRGEVARGVPFSPSETQATAGAQP